MQRQPFQQLPLEFNSISGLTGQSPQAVIQILFSRNPTLKQVIDGLSACLSQMPVSNLLAIVESSELVLILKTIYEDVKLDRIDAIFAEMSVRQYLEKKFSYFSNLAHGEENLIAVIAMLVLLRIPTNDVTEDEDRRIEALKLLFISTLFHNDIATQFMLFRDEFQRHQGLHSSVNCNSRFILSIGWYIAAQEAHDKDAFVENSDGFKLKLPIIIRVGNINQFNVA